MRYLAIAGWVAAALGWYESYASTGRAPTITGIGKGAVRHFRPHCPGCRCDQPKMWITGPPDWSPHDAAYGTTPGGC